ncbi:hypothetical protein [Candidatus Mycosynbacter amalyticus]|nr:hypothetical protein [Candidatus Mycosynbacter amalyticus]
MLLSVDEVFSEFKSPAEIGDGMHTLQNAVAEPPILNAMTDDSRRLEQQLLAVASRTDGGVVSRIECFYDLPEGAHGAVVYATGSREQAVMYLRSARLGFNGSGPQLMSELLTACGVPVMLQETLKQAAHGQRYQVVISREQFRFDTKSQVDPKEVDVSPRSWRVLRLDTPR